MNNTLNIVTEQIKQYPDVKMIYFNKTDSGIKCTVIRNTNNLVENKRNCQGIIANLEIAKELLSKSQITFDYDMKTLDSFYDELKDESLETRDEFTSSEIVYEKNVKTRK